MFTTASSFSLKNMSLKPFFRRSGVVISMASSSLCGLSVRLLLWERGCVSIVPPSCCLPAPSAKLSLFSNGVVIMMASSDLKASPQRLRFCSTGVVITRHSSLFSAILGGDARVVLLTLVRVPAISFIVMYSFVCHV